MATYGGEKAAEIYSRSDNFTDAQIPKAAPTGFQAWWVVCVIMLLNTVSLIDRNIVSLLLVDIRNDLGLTDFQVSLVNGMAFACFYGIMGLVIGSLVDRYPARLIIYVSVTIWSLAAAATGLARNYLEMILARMVIGAGEGGVSPASQALISRSFPANRISLPMSLFSASGLIGMGLSYLCGGALLELVTKKSLLGVANLAPWREVLIITGLPGLLIAFLAFTLPRTRHVARAEPQQANASWADFRALLSAHRALYLRLFFGYGLTSVITYGILSWSPTYARRVLGMTPAEVGSAMGLIAMIGGVASMIAYGYVIDRKFSRGKIDFALRIHVIGTLLSAPLLALAFILEREDMFLLAIVLTQCVLCAAFGPGMAVLQMITPPSMRGRVAAMLVVTLSVGGYTIGPTLIGAITDFVFFDPQRVGWSMAVVAVVMGPILAWCLWSARRLFVGRMATM
jgi:MFS family permease